jgi:hypothetical protein
MFKHTLTAAALAMLLAGPAFADNDKDRRGDERYDHRADSDHDKGKSKNKNKDKGITQYRPDDRGRDDNDWNRGRGNRDEDRRRDDDQRYDRDRRYDYDPRYNNDRRYDNNWRYDNDWSRFDRWRRDGWRHDRGRDDNFWNRGRDWRYVPPIRYRADFGYRSGYELAWRDWDRYGRYNRHWRRRPDRFYLDFGYQAGYEAGWRDASRYFGYGYRPRYWANDPHGGWYFGFHIDG